MNRIALLVLCTLLLAGWQVNAEPLYKHVDKDGKITYSDQPPKDGKGERVDVDPNTNVVQPPKAAKGQSALDKRIDARIATRDKMRDRIDVAKAKVEAAREALKTGQEPQEDERQQTMSAPDNGGNPNAAGNITGKGGKVLCRKVANPDGSERIFCPSTPVPNEAYYERIKSLELALAKAEAELAEAERDFRRNAPD